MPFFYDTFTGTDATAITAHTPDFGGLSWVGNGELLSNRLRLVSYTHECRVDVTKSDGAWEFIWTLSGGETSHFGTLVRYVDSNNYVMIDINETGKSIEITEVTAGTSTLRAYAPLALINGVDVPVRITMQGASVSVCVANKHEIGRASCRERV